jgi:hypothetical protein
LEKCAGDVWATQHALKPVYLPGCKVGLAAGISNTRCRWGSLEELLIDSIPVKSDHFDNDGQSGARTQATSIRLARRS